MEQAPITDRTLNVGHQHPEKFRDVRKKAHLEEINRHRKVKRNKAVKVPKYKVGQFVVLRSGGYSSAPQYCLVEIIDFREDWDGFIYYGFIQKTTESKIIDYIGRLTHFSERGWQLGYVAGNVEDKCIRWLSAGNVQPQLVSNASLS